MPFFCSKIFSSVAKNIIFRGYSWLNRWVTGHWWCHIQHFITLAIILWKYPQISAQILNFLSFIFVRRHFAAPRRRYSGRGWMGRRGWLDFSGSCFGGKFFAFFAMTVGVWLVEISGTIWLVKIVCPRGTFDQSNGHAYIDQSGSISQLSFEIEVVMNGIFW